MGPAGAGYLRVLRRIVQIRQWAPDGLNDLGAAMLRRALVAAYSECVANGAGPEARDFLATCDPFPDLEDRPGTRYASVHAFYAARGGERSIEDDFGVWWTEGRAWPRFRVSCVHDTGDVYAYGLSTGQVELLGSVGHKCEGPVTVRDHGPRCPFAVAEVLLKGWASSNHDLAWVRERLAVLA